MSASTTIGSEDVVVGVDAMIDFGTDALRRVGLPEADARKVIALMVEADLTGAEAHGMYRLPQYVKRIAAGGMNRTPSIEVNRTAAATALVDGDNGMGHLVMSRAAETALDLARESGIGWVGVRRSNHAGPAALYAEMAVAHGMVGIYSAVASANHMAIWGGSESLIGTNPLAIAIPAGKEAPLVLDMATTVVSYGTVKASVLKGKGIAPGWMIDKKTGEALLDADRLSDGLLLPIGGYKGSGLALGARNSRRNAQQRGHGPRCRRLQLRRHDRDQYRSFHPFHRRRPLHRSRALRRRGRSAYPGSEDLDPAAGLDHSHAGRKARSDAGAGTLERSALRAGRRREAGPDGAGDRQFSLDPLCRRKIRRIRLS